jgi:GT2 family glycosyltransferase
MAGKPKVAVIVLGFNSGQWLKDCFNSLEKTKYPNRELIFVDNHSQDNSVQLVKSNFPSVQVVQNEKNLGFAEGNNQGIRLALEQGADYIALVNPDVKVSSDWLDKTVSVGESFDEVGVLTPLQRDYAGKEPDRNFKALLNTNKQFLAEREKGKLKPFYEIPYAIGSSLVIKRKAIEKVGLMDALYFLYVEDVDWCRRARFHGFKVVAVPKTFVKHWHLAVHPDKMPQKSRDYFIRNHFIYYLKDPFHSFLSNILNLRKNLVDNYIFARFKQKDRAGLLYRMFLINLWVFFNLPVIWWQRKKEMR